MAMHWCGSFEGYLAVDSWLININTGVSMASETDAHQLNTLEPHPMRMNLPVTNREFDYPGQNMLVSTTDTKGIITHCNRAFIEVSGYSEDELMGQNHNMIRHPDMPAIGFKDRAGKKPCQER
jgi:PAS domain-containing protein